MAEKLSDEYVEAIEGLQNDMNDQYNQQVASAFEEALTTVLEWPKNVNFGETEAGRIEADAKKYLGPMAIAAAFFMLVSGSTEKLYDIGLADSEQEEIAAKKYLDRLRETNPFWVGKSWDANTQERIRAVFEEMIGKNLNRTGIAERLADGFKNIVEKSTGYWNTLADHMAVKTHEIGQIDAYIQNNVKYLVVTPIIDDRTTVFCKSVAGLKIPVSAAEEQIEKYFDAAEKTDIEAVSSAWPMRNPNRPYTGKPENLGVPPYHFRCRTTLRPA